MITYRKEAGIGQKLLGGISQVQHRGPESPLYWINEEDTVALGHCRLSIIDLDPRSSQPLHFLQRYRIVHNGELYNHLELKSLLIKKGYHFQTASDTEVIVAAYDAFGKDCLSQFDGMFAFAIWDEREKKLFCARDRFGEKPFYFHAGDSQFLFASEMKSLWAMGVPKEVNPALLYNFISTGYTNNPADQQESFYSLIQKLPPASFLELSYPDPEIVIQKYWQIYPEVNTAIGEAQAIEQFTHLFSDSISKRLRSDVAIGTSLSGGLDSSAIVAFCQQLATGHYSHQCFTAAFPGFVKDESLQARLVAEQFQLQQHLCTVKPEEVPQLMRTVMYHQEEPFSSGSVLAQYKVYEAAKTAGIKVLLDGQGADEVLGGYHKYYPWYWQELYRSRQLKKSGETEKARQLGIQQAFGTTHKIAALFPNFAAALWQSRKAKKAAQHQDLNPDFAAHNKEQFYYATPAHFDLNGALYFNTFVQGLEELLRLADRNSMAHAVEVRLPFLSHELVKFVFTLPPHFKIHQGWNKWLLRKTISPLLPESMAWRKDKVGFEPPQQAWMEQDAVSESIREGKKKLVAHGILNEQALRKKIKPHGAHAANTQEWKYWSASFLFD